MGLNGLISRNVGGLVRSFKISGEWKEYDLEEFTRVGRIPDNSMMLNMVVRMAIEKMEKLESFRYSATTPAVDLRLVLMSTQLGAQYQDASNCISRFGATTDIILIDYQIPRDTSSPTGVSDPTIAPFADP